MSIFDPFGRKKAAQEKAAREEAERQAQAVAAQEAARQAERAAKEAERQKHWQNLPKERLQTEGPASRLYPDESSKQKVQDVVKQGRNQPMLQSEQEKQAEKTRIATEKEHVYQPPRTRPEPSFGGGGNVTSKTHIRETLAQKLQREAREKPALDQQRSVLVRQIRERSLDEGEGRKR